MIVQTWCGSYIELNRWRLIPWLLGWWLAVWNPRRALRVRRQVRESRRAGYE